MIFASIAIIEYSVIKTTRLHQWSAFKDFTEFIKQKEFPITVRAEKWLNIKKRLDSFSPSDWKLAVIEADVILDDLLKRMGYKGKTLGERLKSINPANFASINEVWEAHKMRNRIAHEPESALSKDEAEKAILLYEKALKEFEYI